MRNGSDEEFPYGSRFYCSISLREGARYLFYPAAGSFPFAGFGRAVDQIRNAKSNGSV